MKLKGKAYEYRGMRNIDRLMKKYFGTKIELGRYWGPEQMCVFTLIYKYKPLDYTIIIDCERGTVASIVKNPEGKSCFPLRLYPETSYTHYEDRNDHMEELVSMTYKAIKNGELQF